MTRIHTVFSLLFILLLSTAAATSAGATEDDFSVSKVEQNHSPLEHEHLFQSLEDELEKDSEELEELYMIELRSDSTYPLKQKPVRMISFLSQAQFLSLLKVPIV